MRNGTKYIMGALMVIIGILIIFGKLTLDFSWIFRLTWPMIFIAAAFFFFMGYYTRRPFGTGYLVPAGIFLTMGVTFMLGEVFSYSIVWPGFIAAPAVGLLFLYIFGSRQPGLLVPIGILLTLAGVFTFAELFDAWLVAFPGMIMAPAVGLFLLYIGGKRNPTLLIPVFILASISVTIFSFIFMGYFVWALKYVIGGALVLAGIMSIIKKPYTRDQYYRDDDNMKY